MGTILQIGVVAPHGRMGVAICQLVQADATLQLGARIVAPEETGGVHLHDIAPSQVDLIIDFSHREAVQGHAVWCAKHEIGWVLGTTGLTPEDRAAVAQAATATAVFCAANYSLGVALMIELAARAATILGLQADIEISEVHHMHKRDAPSGTALAIGEAVAAARGQNLAEVRRDGRSGLIGERPVGEIGFHAMRLADVVGEHEISFGWPNERLKISHDARDRKVFAYGALRAAHWLGSQRGNGKTGLFGMADLLKTS